jgi:hypothetical protein
MELLCINLDPYEPFYFQQKALIGMEARWSAIEKYLH